MVALLGINNRDYVFSHTLLTISLPLGGMTAIIVGMRAFFRGYGFVLSCLWGLLGFFSSYITVLVLKFVNTTYPTMLVPAVIVITLVYMLICHLTDFRGDSRGDNQLVNEVMEDDIKSELLEPLYYTFKQKSFKFKGSKFNMLDDVTNQIRSISGESVLHYILWSMLFALLVLEMIVVSPKLLNRHPDFGSVKINPSGVIKQIQKDVE